MSPDPQSAAENPAHPGPVVVVTGPTASGKTSLAIEIAERFGGEIVNADSVQVYRFMDIGTAKPSLEERARVPHHLFDVVVPDVVYSAGRYAREARAVAAEIHARGNLVVLTGGTGLYIRAFLDGLIEAGGADPALRAQLEDAQRRAEEEGDPLRLHTELRALDPDAAKRIHPNDHRRVIRALEIDKIAGQSASSLRAEHAFGDRPFPRAHLAIDPGRDVLNPRIDQRCVEMLERGLLQEGRALRSKGYGPELRSMQAIGYRHIQPVIDGVDTLANALEAMQRDTRRFARRQRTWIRGVADVEWMDPAAPDKVFARVEDFLTTLARQADA